MATFTYGGTTHNFPGQSGIFLCSTTATDGTGTQSNPILLQYRGSRKVKRYADRTVWVALGRDAPAVEVGQYSFLGMDLQYSFPATGTDYDGTTAVSGSTIEARLNAIEAAVQSGGFVDLQDARGRRLIGSLTQDFEIQDEAVGWRTVSASICEAR